MRLRRDDDRFAVNGRIGRSRHDGKTSGDCKSIKTHFEIVQLILTAARGDQISPQGESVSIEMNLNRLYGFYCHSDESGNNTYILFNYIFLLNFNSCRSSFIRDTHND